MTSGVVANLKRLVVWLVALSLVGATVFVAWADSPQRARAAQLADAEESGAEIVERRGSYVIRDGDPPRADTGLVFYPGAHVDAENYVPVFAEMVEETGVRVYIPKMPFRLAILDPDRAGSFRGRRPGITDWYVGGHSLGGAMACQYASNNPDRVEGIVLFGSYCDSDISGTNLSVLQILGTRDGVLSMDRVNETAGNLPADARVEVIEGVNHSQFGSYAGQRGDNPAYVDYDLAHNRMSGLTAVWIADNSDYVSPPSGDGTLRIQSSNATSNQTASG
jgi:dienelactone hydrolase